MSNFIQNSTHFDPLDHLDDDIHDYNVNFRNNDKDVLRDRRLSAFNQAIRQPLRIPDNNKIQFLYSPIISTLQLQYVTVGTFTNFWRDFLKLHNTPNSPSIKNKNLYKNKK